VAVVAGDAQHGPDVFSSRASRASTAARVRAFGALSHGRHAARGAAGKHALNQFPPRRAPAGRARANPRMPAVIGLHSRRMQLAALTSARTASGCRWAGPWPITSAAGLLEGDRAAGRRRRAPTSASRARRSTRLRVSGAENERLRGLAPAQVRAWGTQTLREAPTATSSCSRRSSASATRSTFISAAKRPGLTFEGCMHSAPPSRQPRLVVRYRRRVDRG